MGLSFYLSTPLSMEFTILKVQGMGSFIFAFGFGGEDKLIGNYGTGVSFSQRDSPFSIKEDLSIFVGHGLFSAISPFRSGPRHCDQEDAKAARGRQERYKVNRMIAFIFLRIDND